MKKPIIITAFNDNPTYYSFVESSFKMWKKFGYNIKAAYISNNHNPEVIKNTEKYGEIIKYPNINGIESGVQSKISRMILASEQSYFWIVDIDWYILNINWFEEKFKLFNGMNIVAQDVYGGNNTDSTKWPMWSNFGSGNKLKEIINPNNLNYEELIKTWQNIGSKFDIMEDVNNSFKQFSDESLMRRLFNDANYDIKRYKRMEPNIFNSHVNSPLYYRNVWRRIDRAWNWNYYKEDIENGQYLDCFPKRPLNKKDHVISEIFKYIDI